ncbi:MAG: hypothetical protein A2W85_13425 [Bacteroidetes bacterium GWF2_41_31]|nr:MAG: hypothetical protein A2W85_13425 [Bacteroidetes bacterium GWF2_41_31]OFZ02323.1 MAG: hypothetical protein A2338_02740 [Bacteroidetes bacterium RIFOXYB12_FULL_41_6]
MLLKSQNPVLPHGGTKPVVVSETTPIQSVNSLSNVPSGVFFLKEGTLSGGEEIKPGVLHGGEEVKPGVLHGGEEIKPGVLHGGEEIKPGVLHSTNFSPATYRTKDGMGIYKFRFVDLGGKFEIDIDSQPSYGVRNDGSNATHRLPSARGGKKICISVGKEPQTIESAKKICVEWAELTQTYINTGKSIDSQVAGNANPINKLWNNLLN